MLRKDVVYMLNVDWEPKIPSVEIMQNQVRKFDGRLSGSVRLAKGLVESYGIEKTSRKKRSRLQKGIAIK